ncbi:MAG: response regulator [Pseudomonadota bacterium]
MGPKDEIRVLIVDDEKSSLDVLEEFLGNVGFSVLTASNGLQAIKSIKAEDLDIVLTDLKMPGADGIEVLKAAKQVNPNIRVVIITGYASLETTLQAIKEGAYDYITKPFKLEEVAVVLRNVAEKVRLERDKSRLIEDLRNAYAEMDILKESRAKLDREMDEINKRMEEDQAKIAKSLTMLQTIPGNLLPFHYLQTRERHPDRIFKRLEGLGKLKEEGILTEEEFRVHKERLLTQI